MDPDLQRGLFRFRTWDGKYRELKLPDSAICTLQTCRPSGRVLLTFPAPFEHIQISQGELVGRRKYLQIRSAIEALTQQAGQP